ncbi:MAG: hypothetical protein U5K71_10230 [Gracilimonas sp.]|nr:hypothetical protein [Gracilimonas sp.]
MEKPKLESIQKLIYVFIHIWIDKNKRGIYMSKREEYIDKLTAKLKEWDIKLEKLESKAKKSKVEVEADVKKQIGDLRIKKTEASNRLESLKEASDDAWKDLREGIEASLHALSAAFDKAKSRF